MFYDTKKKYPAQKITLYGVYLITSFYSAPERLLLAAFPLKKTAQEWLEKYLETHYKSDSNDDYMVEELSAKMKAWQA